VLLSAGGSAFFDLVALGFQSVQLSRPVRRVLRSGCYLTHDASGYAKEQVRVLRERRVELPEGSLQPGARSLGVCAIAAGSGQGDIDCRQT
jgi:D-serine dehydratase